MPVEFSVAAFRLGHSMIRREYEWNKVFQDGGGTLKLLFTFSGTGGELSENSPLPGNWVADWRRLYDFPAAGHANLKAPPGRFNLAMRIDSRIVNPLDELPLGSLGADEAPADELELNLAFRNLVRSRMVKLASGQQMVRRLKNKGVTVKALTEAQIIDGSGGAALAALTAAQRNAVAANTPLWFYVLREAELNGGKLEGVGARIVVETFHRAIAGSKVSIIRAQGLRAALRARTTRRSTCPTCCSSRSRARRRCSTRSGTSRPRRRIRVWSARRGTARPRPWRRRR